MNNYQKHVQGSKQYGHDMPVNSNNLLELNLFKQM